MTAREFGSRATGRAGRFSDLDLAIDAGRALTSDETARRAEACTESDLPFRVDLLDWYAVDARFRKIVAADVIALAAPDAGDA
ncbi:MAG: nucleotidyltransferase domain-containing protein [Proteobacteria bacterium]|nr:nucleotidyltransferase domain-containing protein [Pseudomonadota bacterium]